MRDTRTTKWQWYSVKLMFESIISGEPEADTIDDNYTNTHKTFEESIVLIKAQSFEHAYKIAENKAPERELVYKNVYGETVTWRFIEAIDCFSIDEDIKTGVEIYSRYIRVHKSIDKEDFIDRYYSDTIENDSGIEYNFILRNRDFNKRPNSQE